MRSRFLIRCDANVQNGFGHFSRCLNLARGIRRRLPQSKIVFLGHYDDIPFQLIKKYQMDYEDGRRSLTDELKFAQDYDYFILDSYLITQEYIDNYCHAPIKFVKIDDFNDFNLDKVDLIINFCFRAKEYSYKNKKNCLGVRYFPVREELREIRLSNINQFKTKIENIVIFMGAADQYNAGVKITKMLDQILKNTRINLITNKTGHPQASINDNQIKYLPVASDVERYLKDADAVITGGGLTKYDCAYSCIANASLSQNPEQDEEVISFAKAGLTYYLGMAQSLDTNKNQVLKELKSFCSMDMRKSIVQCSRDEFSIDSTENLVRAILEINDEK